MLHTCTKKILKGFFHYQSMGILVAMTISIPTHFLLRDDALHDQNWPTDFIDVPLKY